MLQNLRGEVVFECSECGCDEFDELDTYVQDGVVYHDIECRECGTPDAWRES